MLLNVRVSPRASHVKVVSVGNSGNSNVASRNLVKKEDNNLKVYLTRPAQDGLANAQLIDLLAEYFKVKKYQIRIIKGDKSRNKIIEIDD